MNDDTKTSPPHVGHGFAPGFLHHWRVFRPGGVARRPGHYFKLAYGVLGLGFLAFAALTTNIGESETAQPNTPPSAWYWQWLTVASAPTGSEENSNSDDDDPYPIFGLGQDEGEAAAETATASWGTDGRGMSVRLFMGRGAVVYIMFGLLSSLLGVLGGICWAVLTEWPTRPRIPLPYKATRLRRWVGSCGRSSLEIIDTIPKFLLLIALCALGGVLTMTKFTVAMAVFLMFGTATLFRDRIAALLAGEQYLYAMEIGLSRARIFFVHLIGRQLAPLILVQLPFMVSAFLLWEATLSYFNWGPATITWGALLRDNFQRAQCPWALWIPLLSLLLVISSLYVLGDALRERIEPDEI